MNLERELRLGRSLFREHSGSEAPEMRKSSRPEPTGNPGALAEILPSAGTFDDDGSSEHADGGQAWSGADDSGVTSADGHAYGPSGGSDGRNGHIGRIGRLTAAERAELVVRVRERLVREVILPGVLAKK